MTILQLSQLPRDQVQIFDLTAQNGYPLHGCNLITFAYRVNGKAMSKTVRRGTAAIFFPDIGLTGVHRGRPEVPYHLQKIPVRCFIERYKVQKYGAKKLQEFLNKSINSLQLQP
jgi:hypothetical protein